MNLNNLNAYHQCFVLLKTINTILVNLKKEKTIKAKLVLIHMCMIMQPMRTQN